MNPLASAMADAIGASTTVRVPLKTLTTAAAAVDRTGAVSVSWRRRLADAIDELVEVGVITTPRSRWDRSAEPSLPIYVTKVRLAELPRAATREIVWHAELGWAAELAAAGQLGEPDRRLLVQINAWLQRRGDVVVPLRERSLDICCDEKALDGVVFTPLFGPGRLTYEMLRCEPCWPPVHQEIFGDGQWLIVENWTTFRTIVGAARSCGWDGRLIWGAGNQVSTRITSLAATEPVPNRLAYFGDIDTHGMRAARMAAIKSVELGLGEMVAAARFYRLCLTAGERRETAHRADRSLCGWTRDWLPGSLGEDIAETIATGGRIVQETVGVELLATLDTRLLLDE